jgi:hypothetical protein
VWLAVGAGFSRAGSDAPVGVEASFPAEGDGSGLTGGDGDGVGV